MTLPTPAVELPTILSALGYTREWLSLGVVNEAVLQDQYATFLAATDQNPEHYRQSAYLGFLAQATSLTDGELEPLVGLRDAPEHMDMAEQRLIELVSSDVLTDHQLRGLSKYPIINRDPVRKRYRRALVLREMRAQGLTEPVFGQIRDSADGHLQRCLLDHPGVSREHLLWLSESGANRPIRNAAQHMLQSKRFRQE